MSGSISGEISSPPASGTATTKSWPPAPRRGTGSSMIQTGVYRFIQLLVRLVLPWLVMISLGGFKSSSVVIIWAALCPLISLLVEALRRTLHWIVGFVLLLIINAFLQPHLRPVELPEALITWFFCAQSRCSDRDCIRAPVPFRWATKLLPETIRDAAAQHSSYLLNPVRARTGLRVSSGRPDMR
jgi:lysylphosphatidylglycerol synthetase-like protein (DUF2156 family)